jgi:hypothetical protein
MFNKYGIVSDSEKIVPRGATVLRWETVAKTSFAPRGANFEVLTATEELRGRSAGVDGEHFIGFTVGSS